ncbi:glycosyltransferase family 76 protein [Macrolepiota fuliginosa MF-IS2]|uniref:GPI mannosyltransferase 2 n=1 Tax=Macrolepiota fuliginosa MF-IS2 TaxID=1400762 RepID=A0A9P6C6W4_9AGAR|nr:glycosyltransferase family 76 protein [Macrolepiota fuliginosa MF-IS2]
MFLFNLLASRLVYLAVALVAHAVVRPFDASADSANSILIRWDVLHFKDIADNGYHWEHQYAFLPAAPILLRYFSPVVLVLLNTVLAYDSVTTLYELSLRYLANEHIAHLAALLSLVPFSPPALCFAPYTEPFFTHLSYRGMLCCARKQWFRATLFFTLASTFRSNGFFLAGFVIWGTLYPHFDKRRLPPLSDLLTAILSSASILSPFIAHNASAYLTFCLSSAPPQWCSNTLPLIYNHVQSVYWNNGLFKYWSLSQLPNFLIAAPPLFALFSYSLRFLLHFIRSKKSSDPFFNPSIAPHAIHALLMVSILLFASHTQIILRLAPSMPFTYWAAAYIITHTSEHPWISRAWIPWTHTWSIISIILWVAFLPPA